MNETRAIFGPSYGRQNGFSLIELMIVLVIVLVMALGTFGVLSSFEGHKRTTTTTNDINQAGNLTMYQLDKAIRQAGSGFGYNWATSFGCELYASLTNSNGASGQILPFSGTMKAPFTELNATLGGVYRLAPLVIVPGATTGTGDTTDPTVTPNASDALIVMAGTAGYGELPIQLTGISATSLTLGNYVGFNPYDLALIVNDTDTNGATPCMIEEVDSKFVQSGATSLPLGGAYTASTIGTESLTSLTPAADSVAINIGNALPANNNPPSFQIIGVGNNNVLYSYDLLQGGTSGTVTYNTPLPIADSVWEMHAIYYLSGGTWASPATSPYDVATLESAAGAANLPKIQAIRLGLIMRSNVAEQTPVSGPTITLFADTTLPLPRTLSTSDQNYRYRTIEATIPLRNSLMLISK